MRRYSKPWLSLVFTIALGGFAAPALGAQAVRGPYLSHFQKTRKSWDKKVDKLEHKGDIKAILDRFETLFSGYDTLGLLSVAERVRGATSERPADWRPWSSDPVLQAFEHPIQANWGALTMLILDTFVGQGAPIEKWKTLYNESVTSIADRFKMLDIEVPALLK